MDFGESNQYIEIGDASGIGSDECPLCGGPHVSSHKVEVRLYQGSLWIVFVETGDQGGGLVPFADHDEGFDQAPVHVG